MIDHLREEPRVSAHPPMESPENPGRGRPAAVLRLAPSAGAALGIDFGHSHIRVAVSDLAPVVLAERRVEFEVDSAAAMALDTATSLARDLVHEAGLTLDRVLGAGLG